jgi:hypothetical protein
MVAFRTISDLLRSHPRNDIEALALVVAGFFLLTMDPADVWAFYAGYVIFAGYVFQRWYARLQSVQDWPPPSGSTADWPDR